MSCGKCERERAPVSNPTSTHNKGTTVIRQRPPRTLETGVKVVLLGEAATGKTSIVSRLTENKFQEGKESTVGASFQVYRLNYLNKPVTLEIWDTAGAERFRSLTPMYYRGSVAAVIVYDITKRESFDTMKSWLQELKVEAQPAVIMVVGNKLDLSSARTVPFSMLEEFVASIEQEGGEKPLYSECSAKTGQNVKQVFLDVAKALVDLVDAGKLQLSKSVC
eukprot:TRINITY_DN928_c0_g1_i1.p1 TRINITY_DN928_c0_g1~~TRINITY_DN928_c0_g1_i1.p1  ORF type:complete len:221 (-),score=54.79 TRINITY_DN928_c0_g1_i1:96-758(-)